MANQIDTRIRRCIELDSGTYLFVSRIPADMIDPFDQALVKLGIRRGIRLTYEESLESLIIRLMPGAAHENTSGSFLVKIILKILRIPGHSEYSYRTVGATRFIVPGKRSKEGDTGLKPAGTRGSRND